MVYQISFTSSKQGWLLSLCFLVPNSNLIGFPLILSLFKFELIWFKLS